VSATLECRWKERKDGTLTLSFHVSGATATNVELMACEKLREFVSKKVESFGFERQEVPVGGSMELKL